MYSKRLGPHHVTIKNAKLALAQILARLGTIPLDSTSRLCPINSKTGEIEEAKTYLSQVIESLKLVYSYRSLHVQQCLRLMDNWSESL